MDENTHTNETDNTDPANRGRPESKPLPTGRPGPGSRRELGIVNGAIEAIGARAAAPSACSAAGSSTRRR